MAKETEVLGVKTPRGKKMKTGRGWKLVTPKGKTFKAALIKRFNIGAESVAVFRVLNVSSESHD